MADYTDRQSLSDDEEQQGEEEILVVPSLPEDMKGIVQPIRNTKGAHTNDFGMLTENAKGVRSTLPVPLSTTKQGLRRGAEDLAAKLAAVSGECGKPETSFVEVDKIKSVRGLGRSGEELTDKLASVCFERNPSGGNDLTQQEPKLARGLQRTPQERELKRAMVVNQPSVDSLEVGSIDRSCQTEEDNSYFTDPVGLNVSTEPDESTGMPFQDDPSVIENEHGDHIDVQSMDAIDANSSEEDLDPTEVIPLTGDSLSQIMNTEGAHADLNSEGVHAYSDDRLVEATLIVDTEIGHDMMLAQPVDPLLLELQTTKGRKEQECRWVGYILIVVSVAIVAISLGTSLANRNTTTE